MFPTFLHVYKEELTGGRTFHAVSKTKKLMFLKEKQNITCLCPQNLIMIAEKSKLLIKI